MRSPENRFLVNLDWSNHDKTQPIETDHKCIFCEIIRGTAEASTITESERTISFMSLEGHPLLVPKQHIQDIFDPALDPETARELGEKSVELARVVKDVYGADGINVFSTSGRAAGQEVDHYHVHIIPRTTGDKKIRVSRVPFLPRPELDGLAASLRTKLTPEQPQE